jgi:cytochrome c-type biogenesis protein CcmH/NrfG
MRFCPQCGAALMTGAKFCVECGRSLGGGAGGGAPRAGAGPDRPRLGDLSLANIPITTAFVGIFVAITVVGLLAAGWIMLRTPDVVHERIATAPATEQAPAPGQIATNAPQQAAGTSGSQAPSLPPGHPKIELPTEARSFIDKVEQAAKARPSDIVAWNKLGAVSMRAAMFDPTYYDKAEEAYAHVLKLNPDNLDALRGIGDIDYDRQKYDEAVAAYEHYLKKKPDDPEVRTDLGTMYLDTGNADQAVVQYQKAIKAKPDFYQAYVNMGIAYAEQNQTDKSLTTLAQALKLAPDDTAKSRVRDLVAKISGAAPPSTQVASAATAAASAPQPAAPAAPAAVKAAAPAAHASIASAATPAPGAPAAAPTPEQTFQGAIEQMVRGLPVAGPKVGAVEWPDKLKAKVMMDNFPMDQMPPFAKEKFIADLKAGIADAKKQHSVSGKVELDIVDGPSGRVMQTVEQ